MTSGQETRAVTLVECLQRLERLSDSAFQYKHKNVLTIHVLGADYCEGNSEIETLKVFQRFTQHIATQTHVTLLNLVLIGPNVSRKLHLHQYKLNHTSNDDTEDMRQVAISYFVGSFEGYYQDKTLYCSPDVVVCFNAGIWGYDAWLPAIHLVLQQVQVPLLITSYNKYEAGDDEDVLEKLSSFKWLWRPEKNPHGKNTPRATDNANGRILKENNYWMCLTGRRE